MSASSPFRTEDNQQYRWPPEPFPVIEKWYERATHFFGPGEPKPWMKPWVSKLIAEGALEKTDEIRKYLYFLPISPPKEFPVDQAWWDDVLRRGANQDDKAVRNGKKPWKVASLLRMDPKAKVLMYLKALPDIKRDKAADQGTAVHHYAEELSRGNPVDVPDYLVAHVDNALRFFNDFQPKFIEIESVIYSDRFGYAGQFDFLAEIDGKIVMGDYKTSEKGIKESIAPQFALYANADFIGREDGTKSPMPRIDEFWGISIRADDYEVVPVRVDEEIWNMTMAFATAAKWSEVSKTVLGKPIKR